MIPERRKVKQNEPFDYPRLLPLGEFLGCWTRTCSSDKPEQTLWVTAQEDQSSRARRTEHLRVETCKVREFRHLQIWVLSVTEINVSTWVNYLSSGKELPKRTEKWVSDCNRELDIEPGFTSLTGKINNSCDTGVILMTLG